MCRTIITALTTALTTALFLTIFFLGGVLCAWGDNAALDFVNQARKANKLPLLHLQSQLEKAADNHALYMAQHNLIDHEEHAGLDNFTGNRCLERITHTGYQAAICIENLSFGQKNWLESAQQLMSGIYHRMGFLAFDVDEIGLACRAASQSGKKLFYNYVMGNSVLRKMCEGSPSRKGYANVCVDKDRVIGKALFEQHNEDLAQNSGYVVLYPWPDQINVPPHFHNAEIPNPLPGIKLSGQPVSVHFNPVRLRGKTMTMVSFRLSDAAGQDVSLLPVKDKQSDPRFSEYDFAWFPEKVLEGGHTYRVSLDGIAGGQSFTMDWAFTTAEIPFSWAKKHENVLVMNRPKSTF